MTEYTEEEMKYNSLCRDSWNSLIKTPTNDLCVGDIITYGGLGGRLTNFYEVERFTIYYIIFKIYNTRGAGVPRWRYSSSNEQSVPVYPYKQGIGGEVEGGGRQMRIKKTTQTEYLVNDKTKPLWSFA